VIDREKKSKPFELSLGKSVPRYLVLVWLLYRNYVNSRVFDLAEKAVDYRAFPKYFPPGAGRLSKNNVGDALMTSVTQQRVSDIIRFAIRAETKDFFQSVESGWNFARL
jgi:hypothetical protein